MASSIGSTLRWQAMRAKRVASRVRAWVDPPRWLGDVPPLLAGSRICVLATFTLDGRIAARTCVLAGAWRRAGFTVILAVASDRRDAPAIDAIRPHVAGVIVRGNVGYDFGSWGDALRLLPAIRRASLLALANDSVYGPVGDFDAMLRAVDESRADVVAMTDSYQVTHHVQSYLVFYKPRALASAAFDEFWSVRRLGGRQETIDEAELPQMSLLRRAGLTVEALYPTPSGPPINPTLVRWRELLDDGFPFVKVQLLRDNPADVDLAGWDALMRAGGYDPQIVIAELGREPTSAASR